MLAGMWRKGKLLTLLVGIQAGAAIWKMVWRFLKMLRIELPYDPAIALRGIYPKDTHVLEKKGHMHPNVHSSSVHNSLTVEGAEMSFNR